MKKLFPYIIFLFPLQSFAIPVSTTRFDLFPLSIVIILTLEILYFGKIKYLNKSNIIMIGLFCLVSTILCFLFQHTPISRFFSAIFWLVSLLYLTFASKHFYSPKLYKNLIIAILFSSALLMFQYFFLHTERPKALYIEPSTAGLIFYSLFIMLVFRFFYIGLGKVKKRQFLLLIIVFICGIITKSSHLILIFILPILLGTYILNLRTLIPILLFIFPIFGVLIYFLINDPYFVSKFNFNEIEDFNLSQLAWLRGLDQAVYVAKHSPVFGYGIGSTGTFYFPSEYAFFLDKAKFPELSLLDAYSLLFRWVIEIGFVTVLYVFYLIHKKIKLVMAGFKNKSDLSKINQHSLFIFGLCIFIGSLIKEPNYGLSPLFVSIICMSFNNKTESIIEAHN